MSQMKNKSGICPWDTDGAPTYNVHVCTFINIIKVTLPEIHT